MAGMRVTGGIGLRTWLAAILVIFSVVDPTLVWKYGPYLAAAIFLTGNPARFRITGTVFLAVGLLGWMLLSLRWSINPIARQDILIWTSLLVMFLCLQDLIKDKRQVRFLAGAYLVGVFASILQIIGTNLDALVSGDIGRYSIGDINANYLGYAYIAGLAMIVLLWVTKEPSFNSKVGLVTTGVAVIVGIQLTGTRGAEIGAECLLLWLLACKAAKRPPIRLLLTALGIASVVISTGIADSLSSSLDFGSRATGDLSGRLVLWPIARDLWGSEPWTGHGLWAMRASTMWGVDAHNVFLEMGSALGVVGVALFVVLLWSILGAGKNKVDNRLRLLLVGSFLAVSAPAYLSGAWEPTPASWVVLVIFSRVAVLDGPHFRAIPEMTVAAARRQNAF